MDRVNTKTHCRYCQTELSYDEERNCKICLTCNPPKQEIAPPPKSKKNFIDVKLTEERVREIFKELLSGDAVREIVRDELENWHIQKPPVTKKTIIGMTEVGGSTVDELVYIREQANILAISVKGRKKEDVLADIRRASETANREILSRPVFDETNSGVVITEIDGIPWRAKAKELGIPLFQRTKKDVLKDIEEKLAVASV